MILTGCQPTDEMIRWEPFSQGLPGYALTLTVAADPSQPGVIYAGTYHPPGLWRSDDVTVQGVELSFYPPTIVVPGSKDGARLAQLAASQASVR